MNHQPTLSEAMAAAAEAERGSKERRSAALAAMQEMARSGSGLPPEALLHRLQTGRDGTRATFRDAGPKAGPLSTNHADDITSGYAPLSGREDD